jgi:excisionase family DNA binding protein
MDALTLRQVADRLQVSTQTVRRMIARGEFPAPVRVSTKARWPVDVVTCWLAAEAAKAVRS